jgi:hypothetical protein
MVKMHYVRNVGPKVYVLEPKLVLAAGATSLPHVFSNPEQRICLFMYSRFEWNPTMLFVDTIIPWTSEWLFQYEIWVATGAWCGGGEHLVPDSIESKKAEEEAHEEKDSDKSKRTAIQNA